MCQESLLGRKKEKSGKNGLHTKSLLLCVLVRGQPTGAAFPPEGVLEHKPVPVEGGHDLCVGKAAAFCTIDSLSSRSNISSVACV